MNTFTTSSTTGVTWNGPVCQVCGARYIGAHRCTNEDILRRVQELLRLLDRAPQMPSTDRMSTCPCRPENGGSGVCGCVLGGPTVTCAVSP